MIFFKNGPFDCDGYVMTLATIIRTHLRMLLLNAKNFKVSIIKKEKKNENDQVFLLTDVRGVTDVRGFRIVLFIGTTQV